MRGPVLPQSRGQAVKLDSRITRSCPTISRPGRGGSPLVASWARYSTARAPIRRALSDANLKASEINEVVLVGGMIRMPAVQADKSKH